MQPLTFSENTRARASASLVDGRGPTPVGAPHKVSRQAAHRAVRKRYRAYWDAVECPAGRFSRSACPKSWRGRLRTWSGSNWRCSSARRGPDEAHTGTK